MVLFVATCCMFETYTLMTLYELSRSFYLLFCLAIDEILFTFLSRHPTEPGISCGDSNNSRQRRHCSLSGIEVWRGASCWRVVYLDLDEENLQTRTLGRRRRNVSMFGIAISRFIGFSRRLSLKSGSAVTGRWGREGMEDRTISSKRTPA